MIFPRFITNLFDSPERKRSNMRKRIYAMFLRDEAEGYRRFMREVFVSNRNSTEVNIHEDKRP